MIRISIHTSNFDEIKQIISSILMHNELKISYLDLNRLSDLYIIEVNNREELKILKQIKRNQESLVYIIGPKDFDIVNECIRLNAHLYMIKDDLKNEMFKYKTDVLKHIQERFQYYEYKRNGISSQIRVSQIFYIESLRHSIIIHSINGEFVERKNLSEFLKEVSKESFIQIHKSYVVNKQQIEKITSKEILLKNNETLPIGRSYKNVLKV